MTRDNMLTGKTLMSADVKVFPCQERGASVKAPYTGAGFKAATTDSIAMDRWNLLFPSAIFGLPCGMNNVLALDADRHGNGDGVANLLSLFTLHQFDWRNVPTVATPNNGFHFYFNRPAEMGPTRATLCEAVDVRDNGYVIAPECQLSDGRMYRLVEGTLKQFADAIAGRLLPNPPDWMIPMLVHPPAPKWVGAPRLDAVDDESLRNQVKGLILTVLRAKEGNRNKLFFWAACRLGEMVRTDLLALDVAEMLLDDTGTRAGLSQREVRGTAISGLRTILQGDRDER